MKQIKFFSLFVLFVCLFSSCSKTDYQNVIPKDANFVASVNMKSIADDADFQNSSMMKEAKQYLGLVVTGKDKKAVEEIIDDPTKLGIDFSCPAYLFGMGKNAYGLTMRVSDTDDLQSFLELLSKQNMATKPVEKDGLTSGSLFDDVAYAYNKTTLLMFVNVENGSSAQSKAVVKQLMNQSEDDSFTSTEAYDKIADKSSDAIALYGNLSAVPSVVADMVTSFLPKGVKKTDIEVVASLAFGKGNATLSSTIWGKTDEAQKVIDTADDNMYNIKGEFKDMPTASTPIWICMGIKGDWLLKQLKTNKESSQVLTLIERGIDIEQMLRAVDGDLAITVPLPQGSNDIDFMACAQLDNSDFLKDVDYWKQSMSENGMSMTSTGNNTYVVNLDGKRLAWGVDGKTLFIGSEASSMDCMNSTKSNMLASYEDDIKDSKVYAYVDLTAPAIMDMAGFNPIGKKSDQIKSIIFKASSASEMTLKVELKNDENFLKALLQ